MLIVNQGLNAQYFIFRGKDAQAFAKSMDVFPPRDVIVAISPDHFERGQLFETEAGTYVLAMEYEKLSDQRARMAFDKTVAAHVVRTMEGHGRRHT